ncbi:unnamed protein product, partial [Bubo scandiacus]
RVAFELPTDCHREGGEGGKEGGGESEKCRGSSRGSGGIAPAGTSHSSPGERAAESHSAQTKPSGLWATWDSLGDTPAHKHTEGERGKPDK